MTCNAFVTPTRGRYIAAATCRCGWVSRGYMADHAAQIMADAHNAEAAEVGQCAAWWPAAVSGGLTDARCVEQAPVGSVFCPGCAVAG